MQYIVLDTDVASYSIKGRLDSRLTAQLTNYAWCVTFVTVGELWRWADARCWGPQSRDGLRHWLSRVRTVGSDRGVSQTWGRICASASRRGRPRQVNDSWVAACCLSNGLPLATINVKDYEDFADHEGLVLL